MKKVYWVVVAAFVLLYILPLGFRPLLTPDETRYAEIGRELIVHNDWVVPKINNLRYFEKPIMGHWLNALSIKLFGENNFAVRFSSAFFVGVTGLILFGLINRYSGPKIAIMATIIFLTSVLVYAVGTFAVLDGALTGFITAAMACFFMAHQEKKIIIKQFLWLSLFGICCGLAFLTKGFLAIVIPAITIIPFLYWEKRLKSLLTIVWVPAMMMILTVLPWTLLVHYRDGDFWNYFFWVEHVQRFLRKEESQHPEQFWFFFPILLAGIFPWVLMLPTIAAGYRNRLREVFNESLLRYALCWLILPFIFFSASSGKLATYILPCIPPLAILLSYGLCSAIERNMFNKINLSIKILMVLLGIAAIGLLGIQILSLTGTMKFTLYGTDETFKWLLILSAIAIWLCLLTMAIKRSMPWQKIILFTLGPLAALWAYNLAIPNLVLKAKAPEQMLLANKWRVTPDTIIVSYKNLLTSICWYYKRDNVYLYSKAGELTYGLNKPDAIGRLLDKDGLLKLIQTPVRGKILVIIESPKLWKDLPPGKNATIDNKTLFVEY